jgi:hypothetical protein
VRGRSQGPAGDLLRGSTVYSFHVPSLNAIKVGFGTDGETRMRSYSRQYGVSPAAHTLREWKLPASSIASAIESACHAALIEAGLARIAHVVEGREAQELFGLGRHTYERATVVVAEAIETTIDSLRESLGTQKAKIQAHEAQRRRYALRDERKNLRAAVEALKIDKETWTLQKAWPEFSGRYVLACGKAAALRAQFKPPESRMWEKAWKVFFGLAYAASLAWFCSDVRDPSDIGLGGFLLLLFCGLVLAGVLSVGAAIVGMLVWGALGGFDSSDRKREVAQLKNWEHWKALKALIPELYYSGRDAKWLYAAMSHNAGALAEKAAARAGFSLSHPGHGTDSNRTKESYSLPSVAMVPAAEAAFVEVRLAVQRAAWLEDEIATELLRSEPDLLSLVSVAQAHPPIELKLKDPKSFSSPGDLQMSLIQGLPPRYCDWCGKALASARAPGCGAEGLLMCCPGCENAILDGKECECPAEGRRSRIQTATLQALAGIRRDGAPRLATSNITEAKP